MYPFYVVLCHSPPFTTQKKQLRPLFVVVCSVCPNCVTCCSHYPRIDSALSPHIMKSVFFCTNMWITLKNPIWNKPQSWDAIDCTNYTYIQHTRILHTRTIGFVLGCAWVLSFFLAPTFHSILPGSVLCTRSTGVFFYDMQSYLDHQIVICYHVTSTCRHINTFFYSFLSLYISLEPHPFV